MAHTATSSNEWITNTLLAETAQPQLNDQEMAVITHSLHAASFVQRTNGRRRSLLTQVQDW